VQHLGVEHLRGGVGLVEHDEPSCSAARSLSASSAGQWGRRHLV
jgi:hypothetical protein